MTKARTKKTAPHGVEYAPSYSLESTAPRRNQAVVAAAAQVALVVT